MLIAIAAVGFIVQARLRSVFRKYSKPAFQGGLTGREVAEKMLRDNGIDGVKVAAAQGTLTDNYNPSNKTISLSEGVYAGCSVSAAAVAAHECGHAIQHAAAYGPLKMRSALVPLVMFSSQWAFAVILAGMVLINISNSYAVFWIGISMIALSTLFSLITLPVEFDASRRAMAWLRSSGTMNEEQLSQAKKALSWAACTYLVAALSAIVTLIYFMSFARNRS